MTRRQTLALVRLALLPLLFGLAGCDGGREPGELTSWTQTGLSNSPGIRVNVDPGFEHSGPPWMDGHAAATEGEVTASLYLSAMGTRYLQLSGTDGFQWVIVSFNVIEEAPGLEAGASYVNDVVILNEDGEEIHDLPPRVNGAVRLNTLDWTADEPVHFEFSLHVTELHPFSTQHVGEEHSLRGSATLTPEERDR